jgi:hypothetical protein
MYTTKITLGNGTYGYLSLFEPAALRVRCSSWRPSTFLHLDFVHGGEQLFNNVVLTFPYFRFNVPETIDYNRKVVESKG